MAMSHDRPARKTVSIEMIADLACPWCYLGLVRFEKAAALRPGIEIRFAWWPYLLNPQLPADGMDRQTYMRAKFGSDTQARQIYQRIEAAGREEGVLFAFDLMKRTPNTSLAQRLILHAQNEGFALPVIRALFQALFEEGKDIGKISLLLHIAEVCGFRRETIEPMLKGPDYGPDILRGHQRAETMGVRGVPVFIAERQHVIAGAQPPEVLAGLLDVAVASDPAVA